MSVAGTEEPPPTTGSIGALVKVREPLPQTLAYSDATKIGEAAAAALWQAGSETRPAEWMNSATGSSGTLEPRSDVAAQSAEGCRGFDTIVTSVAGVHQYSGQICRQGGGHSVIEIDESSPAQTI